MKIPRKPEKEKSEIVVISWEVNDELWMKVKKLSCLQYLLLVPGPNTFSKKTTKGSAGFELPVHGVKNWRTRINLSDGLVIIWDLSDFSIRNYLFKTVKLIKHNDFENWLLRSNWTHSEFDKKTIRSMLILIWK